MVTVILRCWDDRQPSGGADNTCPLLLLTTRQRDHLSLLVVVGHLVTNKADGDGGSGRHHTTVTCLVATNYCPPSACASADNMALSPLPPMKCHYQIVTNWKDTAMKAI